MLPSLLASANHPARRGLFWTTLAALALAQLAALWVLCNHQVQAAEARHAGTRMERVVLADCLRYVPDATLATCKGQVADAGHGATVPVGYTFH